MRAAIYARVSTERQERQQTIDSQLVALRAWIQAQNHLLADAHVFRDEGYSGSRLDRPGLDGLRDAIRDAVIDVVAVFSPDRLARKYAYQVLLLEEFRRADCEVVFLHHPISDNPDDQLLLQIQGATPEGKKELVGFQVGMRESTQSWRELLADLKSRGLAIAPELATGDGALGFWKALEEVFPSTRHQRCTVHKTANVLDKLPTSVQPAAKRDLRQIWTAPDRKAADAAIALFAEKYGAKYERAVACLVKDRDVLLTFHDFPAEHWDHLRTANPIESVFATVRHRTVRTKGALSQDTARLMVFKLIMTAAKTWRRLKGENQLPKFIAGVTFRNGVEVIDTPKQTAA